MIKSRHRTLNRKSSTFPAATGNTFKRDPIEHKMDSDKEHTDNIQTNNSQGRGTRYL